MARWLVGMLPGRLRIEQAKDVEMAVTPELILRLAKENLRLGCRRIQGNSGSSASACQPSERTLGGSAGTGALAGAAGRRPRLGSSFAIATASSPKPST